VAQPRVSAKPSSCPTSTNFLVISPATQLLLDVDSDRLNDFDVVDQKYLEAIVELIRKQHFA
jgi:hypothetical protein